MQITPVRPDELGPDDIERWREMQRATPSLQNPFLSPEFTLAVGRARDTARVAVLEDGQKIVGFLPYERRGRFVGAVIGAGISDCQALVHAPGVEWDAKDLIRACGLPVWEFDHLIAEQAPFAGYHRHIVGSPIMDVSEGYAAYVAERLRVTKGIIRDAQRKMRKLEREVGPVRFDYDVTDRETLRLLMRWKSDQYRRTRVFDRFAAPWIVRVADEILASRAAGCTGALSVLYAGDRPVAAHFGMRSETVLSYWFPAYDPDLGKYSAGVGLLLRMAERAAADGLRHVDLGRGQTRYKDELKNGELSIAEGRVAPSRSVSAVRRTQGAVRHGVSQVRRRRPLRHVRRLAAYLRQHRSGQRR